MRVGNFSNGNVSIECAVYNDFRTQFQNLYQQHRNEYVTYELSHHP